MPKYKGNLLDPPLRSRFQAHLVNLPSYADFFKCLTSSNKRVSEEIIKNLCDFAYSFYADEMGSLNLVDFPVENLDKVVRIMNACKLKTNKNAEDLDGYNDSYLNTSKLLFKLYPHNLLLKDEETNRKMYFDLMQKFNLKSFNLNQTTNEVDYKLVSLKDNNNNHNQKTLSFKAAHSHNKPTFSIGLVKGVSQIKQNDKDDGFIMNDYHSSQLVDMMLNHSSGHDFCLIGGQGKF